MDAGANTSPLGHLELNPGIAVLPPCTRKTTTLLLVHVNPVNVGEVARCSSKSSLVKREYYMNCSTDVMATHVAESWTKEKCIEEVNSSISAHMSSGSGAALTSTSSALWGAHL